MRAPCCLHIGLYPRTSLPAVHTFARDERGPSRRGQPNLFGPLSSIASSIQDGFLRFPRIPHAHPEATLAIFRFLGDCVLLRKQDAVRWRALGDLRQGPQEPLPYVFLIIIAIKCMTNACSHFHRGTSDTLGDGVSWL